MKNVFGLRGPEQGVLEEQRIGLGFLKPGHGLRKVALGIFVVAESESGALSPNAGGMFIGEGGELVVSTGRVEMQITREGRKLFLRGSIFGSIGVERRRRNIRLASGKTCWRFGMNGLFLFVSLRGRIEREREEREGENKSKRECAEEWDARVTGENASATYWRLRRDNRRGPKRRLPQGFPPSSGKSSPLGGP